MQREQLLGDGPVLGQCPALGHDATNAEVRTQPGDEVAQLLEVGERRWPADAEGRATPIRGAATAWGAALGSPVNLPARPDTQRPEEEVDGIVTRS